MSPTENTATPRLVDEAAADAPLGAVAVRTLCEFAARRGDLDLRFTPSPSGSEGVAGHGEVTSRRGAGYQREVPLASQWRGLRVQGRADGWDASVMRLEEIKTHRGDAALIADNARALHWAQARVYGWMLCEQLGLERIELVLVYFNIDTGQETPLSETQSASALRAHFEDLCERYSGWARQERAHRAARDTALRVLAFPFPEFRAGQRALAEAVYRAHAAGRVLMAQAPTGIGKTVGSLFPAMDEISDPPTKRWRIRGGLSAFEQAPTTTELVELSKAAQGLRAAGEPGRAAALEGLERKLKSAMRSTTLNRLAPDLEALVRAETLAVQAGPRASADETVLAEVRQAVLAGQPLGFTLVERNGKGSAIDIKIEGEPMPIEDSAPRARDQRLTRTDSLDSGQLSGRALRMIAKSTPTG